MRRLWIAVLLSGCDGQARVEVERTDGSTLMAQLAATRVSIDGELARDGDDLILRGHTNRALTGGRALARDGPDGALETTTSHAFVLRWPDGELGALADGEVRLAELDFRSTARAPPTYALRLICGLRLITDGLDAPLLREGDDYVIGGHPIAATEVWAHVDADPLALVRTAADGTVSVVQARVVVAVDRMALGEGDPRSVFGADGLR
jgi:hypothetical protein